MVQQGETELQSTPVFKPLAPGFSVVPLPTSFGMSSLDDRYARVILDELMPVLYDRYNISRDPERHEIGGASSGAIAAFTVAWERPDQFRKVLSIVGSFYWAKL